MDNRKNYTEPNVQIIRLDKEISLQLQSNEPPTYEQILNPKSPDYLHINPMKDMST